MSRKKNYKKKWSEKKTELLSYPVMDDGDISREKEKARKMRNTSWWKNKCSIGKCSYCGIKIPPNELTMDHVIPLSRGGKSEKFNIVPACKECNNKKKYLLPAEWKEHLEMIKNKTANKI